MDDTPAQNEFLDKLAEDLFTAYNVQGPNPWKTHDGKPVPKWNELGDQVRVKWKAVAARAIDVFTINPNK